MLLQQTFDLSVSQLASPLRRNASPISDFRHLQNAASPGTKLQKSIFQKSNQQQNKFCKLHLPSRNKIRQHRLLKVDDPLLIYSPISQLRKPPPSDLFIQYLDGEISTQDLVTQTLSENREEINFNNSKFQDLQLKRKPTKLTILQKFLQDKINKRTSVTDKAIKVANKTQNEISMNEKLEKISNSTKKLKQLQILFFPKMEIQKTEDPVFNYRQIFNVESDQLLNDIVEEKKKASQEKFHQLGKELVIKLQSKQHNKEPKYIPMEREVIITKDVQLYGYLHESQKHKKIPCEEKPQNQKIVFMRYKGTQRKIPIKKSLRFQKLYVPEDPYMIEEPYSSDTSLESDQQSYNLSHLRVQDMRSYEDQYHNKQSNTKFDNISFSKFSCK